MPANKRMELNEARANLGGRSLAWLRSLSRASQLIRGVRPT
jgi:hypothetical protein